MRRSLTVTQLNGTVYKKEEFPALEYLLLPELCKMQKPGVILVIILGIIDVCNAQACLSWTSSENEELLQQYRRESIRRQILRKLDLTQPPNNPDPTFVGQDIAEVLAEYEAIAQANELVGSVGGSCTEYNHYAHDVLVFFPTEVNTTRSQQQVSDLSEFGFRA